MIEYRWTMVSSSPRRYELTSEARTVGEVGFEPGPSTVAHASAGGQQWWFARSGFFKPVVTVWRENEKEPLVIAVQAGGRCRLSIVGASGLRWVPTDPSHGEFAWMDDAGTAGSAFAPT